MPKKIENPLREGLPSKIYLLSYCEPLTAYEIAKRIYGVKPPHIPPTSKVSTWVKKMKENGTLSENEEKKTYARVDPLIVEIESTLKEHDVELSDFEKHMISRLLDSQEFRWLVKKLMPPMSYDIDSAWIIMNHLALVASVRVLREKMPEVPQLETPRGFIQKHAGKLEETREFRSLEKIGRFPSKESEFDERLKILRRFWETKEFRELTSEITELLKEAEVFGDLSDEEVLEFFKLDLLLRSIPISTLEKLTNLGFLNRLISIPALAGFDFFPFHRLERVLEREVNRMKTRERKKLLKNSGVEKI